MPSSFVLSADDITPAADVVALGNVLVVMPVTWPDVSLVNVSNTSTPLVSIDLAV